MMAADAGAEDFGGRYNIEIITAPDTLKEVEQLLINKGFTPTSAELTMIPKTTVTVTGEITEKALKLLDVLEEHDDVQNIYCNADFQEE